MPRRSLILANGEIYHIYNRSIAKTEIFTSKVNLRKAIETTDYYRFAHRIKFSKYKLLSEELKVNYLSSINKTEPLIEIYSFAFMPNHFHFLLKQTQNDGISKFISNLQNSFAKYFNLKNDREGTLFQNSFKAKRIESDEEFIHVARYIHLNPITSFIINFEDLASYPWCSYSHYINKISSLVNIDLLLKKFATKERFIKFTADQVDYQRKLADIKRLILE